MDDTTATIINIGSRLGPYTIEGSLGAGGMGQVYRAEDTRLGRKVAIKVSQQRFSDRFEREARAIAALNHPNICTLYDVGPNYLVMELVEGQTLADRLRKGKLPAEQVLLYGGQIADALAAAQAKGIAHRDLKPGNIMIARAGIKVLDFGLAKSEADETLTLSRAVMGTPAYMAPEQRAGKPCDGRADIYSLGLILAEMAAGKRGSFEGLESPLALVVERCLKEDPSERWQSASDLKATLELAGKVPIASAQGGKEGRRRLAITLAAAIALSLGAVAVTLWAQWRPSAAVRAIQFEIPVPKEARNPGRLSTSPDGRYFAFSARGSEGAIRRLWLRAVDSLEARILPGTEGAGVPFWSPDSRFVGFITPTRLMKVSVDGGPAQTICECVGGGGTWSKDGVILYTDTAGRLMQVAAGGGLPAAIFNGPVTAPEFLPDGRHFLYKGGPGNGGVFVGLLGAKNPSQNREVMATPFAALYAPTKDSGTGRILFMRDDALFAQPFDERRLAAVGDAVPLAEHIQTFAGVGYFGASTNDVLIYRLTAAVQDTQLTWLDRQGKTLGIVGEPASHVTLHLSPDNSRAAFTRVESPTNLNSHLWLLDLTRGTPARLTSGAGSVNESVWSPEGDTVVFLWNRDGQERLYRKPAGGGKEELLLTAARAVPMSWSKDGSTLLFRTFINGRANLRLLPLVGERKPATLLRQDFDENDGSFSPDGRWVAYASNESGRNEIYVRGLSLGSSDVSGVPISKDGGDFPHWRADGKELIYLGANRSLMSVDLDTSSSVHASAPKTLFQLPLGADVWDVTSDAKRFLVAVPPGEAAPPPFTVILNWQAKLKK